MRSKKHLKFIFKNAFIREKERENSLLIRKGIQNSNFPYRFLWLAAFHRKSSKTFRFSAFRSPAFSREKVQKSERVEAKGKNLFNLKKNFDFL